jgi:hypothetical protein
VIGSLADDNTIANDWRLFRRISPEWLVPDGAGGNRVSSQAFQNHPTNPLAFSVHIERVLQDLGLPYETIIAGHSGYSVVAITAALVRQHKQVIQRAADVADPAHAHVLGLKPGSVKKAFSKAAVWVIPPAS